jgi:tRNA threonylcarbamoyladenosine biosynthesis protein TsaE
MAALGFSVVTRSVRATESLARKIGTQLAPGNVLTLDGELGAGKTAFVRGLAAGLGVGPGQVTSPTYALVHEYPGERATLVHLDLYRLATEEDARALGIEEQLARTDAVVAIEWAERLPGLVARAAVRVRLESTGGSTRKITVEGLARP